MHGRTARDYFNLRKAGKEILRQMIMCKAGQAVFDSWGQCMPQRVGLLVNFLEHKMLIAFLLRLVNAPTDGLHGFGMFVAV
ncbi:hypothetical protein SDC9_207474 [bioreactor metagenome]|uniref:Uncharacterized protein n=1 Tax=bioreactor metagenome TaxID=1076179 RepID=A0A645J9H1_9ZZZZ